MKKVRMSDVSDSSEPSRLSQEPPMATCLLLHVNAAETPVLGSCSIVSNS